MTTLLEYIDERVPKGFRNPEWLKKLVESGKWIEQNHYGDYLVKDEPGFRLWASHPENMKIKDTALLVFSSAEIRMGNPNGQSYWITLHFDKGGNYILK